MKNLILGLLASACLCACTQASKSSDTSDLYAIDSIAFFTNEQSFDSVRTAFENKFSNPNWKSDLLGNYPFVYKDWGMDNITGLFLEDGSLVGVLLSSIETEERMSKNSCSNLALLDSVATHEFGKAIDAHQMPSENIVKEKGNYPYKIYQKGNRCALYAFSWSNENLHANLYVYRADKIKLDKSKRRIDSDLTELNKLR